MKTYMNLCLCALLLMLFSCGQEKKSKELAAPQIEKYPDGSIEFETFHLSGGIDSVNYYTYFQDKKIKSRTLGTGRGDSSFYSDNIMYDSTGNRTSESLSIGESRPVRDWMLKYYCTFRQGLFPQDEFWEVGSDKKGVLFYAYNGNKPVEISFLRTTTDLACMQYYDSLGKIVLLKSYGPDNEETVTHFDTPAAQTTFSDTLLSYALKLQKQVPFPSGNK